MTSIFDEAEAELKKHFSSLTVLRDEPMSAHTAFRIGGRTPLLAVCDTPEKLSFAAEYFQLRGIRPLVIGNGSNLLVDDCPLRFPVIQTHSGKEEAIRISETEIEAPAGITLSRLAVFAMKNGLTGLEFAHGIPGSLGGAVFMNAGAYGGEMANTVVRAKAFGADGIYTVQAEEMDFSYRHSRFSESNDLVLSAVLRLAPGRSEEISARMEELMAKRKANQPLDKPSAGSTFKRPAGAYAAALIDSCGLKGYTIGGAAVSTKHAGFVVNLGDAGFSDVMAVMEHVRETVQRETGFVLEPEVRIIHSEL